MVKSLKLTQITDHGAGRGRFLVYTIMPFYSTRCVGMVRRIKTQKLLEKTPSTEELACV